MGLKEIPIHKRGIQINLIFLVSLLRKGSFICVVTYVTYPLLVCDVPHMYLRTSRIVELRIINHTFIHSTHYATVFSFYFSENF